MQERHEWIDAVKGTCLCLVVISHLWRPCPLWTKVLTGGYMQVFFIMAGITSIISNRSFKEQILQKSKRLLLPYAVYGIILIILGVILPANISLRKGLLGLLYGRCSIYPPSMASNFPLLQACGYLLPFWFLPCIFVSYVLLAWYDHSQRPYIVVILAIIVGIVSPLLPILLPWSIEMAFIGFFLMLCGRFIQRWFLTSTTYNSKTFFKQLLLGLGCIMAYMTVWHIDGPVNMSLSEIGNATMPFPFRFPFFCLLGICETIFLSLFFHAIQSSFITRSMAYIGRHALRLLCIHLFIGTCVYFLLANWNLPKGVVFACAIMTILLVDYFIEYSLRIIKSILEKKTVKSTN